MRPTGATLMVKLEDTAKRHNPGDDSGFHILLDGYDGFGGLGVGALQYLRDEYPSKSTLVFPTLPSTFPDSTAQQDSCRVLNLMFCLQNVSEHCSLFAPLCLGSKGWRQPGPPRTFPHLLYDASLAYHSSAILATALDTITLRYRCRESSASGLAELCDELSRHGRRAAATSLGLPFAMKPDGFLLDTLETWQGPLWQSLSPNCLLEEDRIWMQSVVLRGITPNRMRNPKKEEEYTLKSNQAYTCTSIKDMLSLFLSCCSYATLSHVTVANSACRVTAPFPQIYSDYVSIDGSISDTKRFENTSVYSVPAIAGLHTSSSVGTMLESLHFQSNRLQFKKFHHFSSAGLEEDEYTECLDQLLQLRECYYEEFDV
uniref:DML1/Misato tubulin domain-containing protein n=2 Tax=Timema TaxID=61471 RepID=A0A7R9CMC6_TIMPO|nr:unnamed protein product [Timema douglasi]CAD7397703.1 unnamed protein product [Timema poppensis]